MFSNILSWNSLLGFFICVLLQRSKGRGELLRSSSQGSNNSLRSAKQLEQASDLIESQQASDLIELRDGDIFGENSLVAHMLGKNSIGSYWDASIVALTNIHAFFLSRVRICARLWCGGLLRTSCLFSIGSVPADVSDLSLPLCRSLFIHVHRSGRRRSWRWSIITPGHLSMD